MIKSEQAVLSSPLRQPPGGADSHSSASASGLDIRKEGMGQLTVGKSYDGAHALNMVTGLLLSPLALPNRAL